RMFWVSRMPFIESTCDHTPRKDFASSTISIRSRTISATVSTNGSGSRNRRRPKKAREMFAALEKDGSFSVLLTSKSFFPAQILGRESIELIGTDVFEDSRGERPGRVEASGS